MRRRSDQRNELRNQRKQKKSRRKKRVRRRNGIKEEERCVIKTQNGGMRSDVEVEVHDV